MSGCNCSRGWSRFLPIVRTTLISVLVSVSLLAALAALVAVPTLAAQQGGQQHPAALLNGHVPPLPLVGPAAQSASQGSPDFAQEVVILTNRERASNNLPPLKSNPQLGQAAQSHSQSMADGNYMDHLDPTTQSTFDQRVSATGYDAIISGENVAAGAPNPQEVVQGWMQSPGHRENILRPNFREIGVGYAFDPSDTFPCGGQSCKHYWTQNFGASQDVFPVVINGEESSTTSPDIELFSYGAEWAEEMRFSNDGGPFTAWEPFKSTYSWTLTNTPGEHTVTVELRDSAQVTSASDTIVLDTQSIAQPTTSTITTPIPSVTTGVANSTPGPAAGEIVVDRRVSTSNANLDDEVSVTLELTSSTDVACDRQVRRTPADIMVVIDSSASMIENLQLFTASKLDAAKEAAQVFVDQLSPELDQVGVVKFDSVASLEDELTNDPTRSKESIEGIAVTGSGTNIAAGISEAHKELIGSRHRPDAIQVIVLLSDGKSDLEDAQREANLAKGDGIRIVTIGLGQGDEIDRVLLESVAFKPEDAYITPSTDKLNSIYTSIAQTIQEFAPISNLEWVHTFDATNFELIPSSVNPPAQVAGNIITWRIPSLNDRPLVLSYRLRTRTPGSFEIDRGDRLTYIRCEQIPRDISYDPALPVAVQGTAQVSTLPAPISEPICEGFPWWLLLALLFILLMLVAWMLLSRRRKGGAARRSSCICELLRLLLFAYLLFLLAMLLGQLITPALCSAREAIYFTRVEASGRASVLVRPTDPERPLYEFKDIQKTNCPSCHVAVSPNGQYAAVVAEGGNSPISMLNARGEIVDIPSIIGSFASWSPDSTRLAYSAGDRDISVLDLGTGQIVPVDGASNPQFIETMPTWSSDGSKIAFVRPVSASTSLQQGVPTDIYVVPSQGGVATLLAGASANGYNYYPAYSPNGQWLAFTKHTTGTSSTYTDDAAEIYIVPADGGQPIRLAANDGPGGQALDRPSNSWPSWSPDGRRLAFGSKRNEQFDIFITDIDAAGNSGDARLLTGAADRISLDHLPSWSSTLQRDPLGDLLGLWPWLIPIPILLLLAYLLCRTEDPLPSALPPHLIELDRTVNPTPAFITKDQNGRIVKRDRLRVELTLHGNPAPCPQGERRKPLDVAFVIDVSGSMDEKEQGVATSGKKLDGAKRAAILFVSKLDLTKDRVAVVPFSTQAQLLLPLSSDGPAINSGFNSLKASGKTSLHDGVRVGLEALNADRRLDADRIILLLSDGQSAPDPAMEQATEAKRESIRIITVGLGDDADKALLQQLATQQTDFHFAPDASGLDAIYNSIALDISSPVGPTDVTLEHNYDAENFVLDVGSVFPDRPAHVVEGKIIWRFERLVGDLKLSYVLEPVRGGKPDPIEYMIDRGDEISYRHCGEATMTYNVVPGLPVKISEMDRYVYPPARSAPEPLPVEPPTAYWQPDSALIIGVGGTGRWVLTQLKKNLLDAGAGELPSAVKLVVVDTSEYELINGQQVPVQFAGVEISPSEVVKLDENLGGLIRTLATDDEAEPELKSWFPDYGQLTLPEKDLSTGTYGRRPLARAGLVRDVQKAGASRPGAQATGAAQPTEPAQSSRIWNLLTEAADRVSSEGGVRIIVVGSLAGGMSGTLWDMAYLAHRAVLARHGDAVSATIEGYFATNTTFNSLNGVVPQKLAANTFAAMRELRRFQLNPGLPYPMVYTTQTRAETAEILSSTCDWRLFSDVFLYGPHYAALSEPHNGTFASMADIIALRLDKASHGAGGGDWYNQMRAQVSQHQLAEREMAIGTAGSFVYRLPAYDIMEIVKLRWVRALLELFMMGQTGAALRLTNPNLAGDPVLHGVTAEPGGLVPIFLRGWLRPDQQNTQHWRGASALGALASEEDQSQSFEDELSRVLEDKPDMAQREFDAALGYTLKWILNGADSPEAIQSRAGKLGYAVRFLEALDSRLAALKERLAAMVSQAAQDPQNGPERAKRLQALQASREQFALIASRYRGQMEGITQALSRSIAQGKQGQGLGLFEIVSERAKLLETTWRKQMNDVKVREYLWTLTLGAGPDAQTMEIADVMYARHAVAGKSPERYVDYLWWSLPQQATEEVQSVVLTLLVASGKRKGQYELSSAADVQAFLDELLALAQSVLRDAWEELWTGQALLDAVGSRGLLTPGASPVAATLRERGQPTLDFDAGASPRHTILAVADDDLAKAVRAPLDALLKGPAGQALGQLQLLSSTDRSSIQLVSTVDVVLVDKVRALLSGAGSAREQYINFKEQTVAYPEESTAETWEVGRRDYDRSRVVLHPLVVAGLADPARAECFALAYAAGMIFEDNNRRVIMQIPGGQETRSLVAQTASWGDPLVMAFLNFTLTERLKNDSLAQAVCAAVSKPAGQSDDQWRPADQIVNQWRRGWGDQIPTDFVRPGTWAPDRTDLGRLIYRIVGDELVRIHSLGR
jgi:uncharacterized protein YkwD/Mg-chelatase subunit ChlD